MTTFTGPSRFQFVGAASLAPGQCILSGQSVDLVDTGRYIQGYGRVYLSIDTIRELAQSAGLLAPVDANLQQTQWYSHGYSDAVKKDFDGSLRDLVRELSDAADRLERVSGVAAVEAYADAPDDAAGERADAGYDVRAPAQAGDGDERAAEPARSGKGRSSVQRTSLDDAFGR